MPKTRIIEKELSYEVTGALFDAYKDLGSSFHEKYCQRAVEVHLKKRDISYQKECPVDISVQDVKIGKHFIDFFIENKVILEIKRGNKVSMSHIKQVLAYLRATNVTLGILAYFGNNGVTIKRIINNRK